MATVHPSSILRTPDDASRLQQKQAFIRDLKIAAGRIRKLPKAA
jgi:uracil-DNA glycosylase